MLHLAYECDAYIVIIHSLDIHGCFARIVFLLHDSLWLRPCAGLLDCTSKWLFTDCMGLLRMCAQHTWSLDFHHQCHLNWVVVIPEVDPSTQGEEAGESRVQNQSVCPQNVKSAKAPWEPVYKLTPWVGCRNLKDLQKVGMWRTKIRMYSFI